MPDRPVILDTCILITFGNADALDVLTQLGIHTVATCPRVVREVVKPPADSAVRDAVDNGRIHLVQLDPEDPGEQETLRRFDGMPAFRGRADAEVLALAVSRELIVASDEARIRSAVRSELGSDHMAGTLSFLVWAVRERRVSLNAAESLLRRLDSEPQVSKWLSARGQTLRDLI